MKFKKGDIMFYANCGYLCIYRITGEVGNPNINIEAIVHTYPLSAPFTTMGCNCGLVKEGRIISEEDAELYKELYG